MQYSVLIATIFAAFIAVASAGRFFKRPLMEGHNWKMPKTMGENARVHVDDVHNFHELASAFIETSLAEMRTEESTTQELEWANFHVVSISYRKHCMRVNVSLLFLLCSSIFEHFCLKSFTTSKNSNIIFPFTNPLPSPSFPLVLHTLLAATKLQNNQKNMYTSATPTERIAKK